VNAARSPTLPQPSCKRSAARLGAATLLILLSLSGCAREGAFGPSHQQLPDAYDAGATASLRIPGGKSCLRVLDKLGVKYRTLTPRGQVETPIEVLGDIAGIKYTHDGRPSLICDCRLALALHWAAPVLAAWHVTEVEHYGAYANRGTRRGRASLHARGLALDAARFKFAKVSQNVAKDYARGWGAGCWPEAPAINQVVCQLRGLRLFRELITPDHDADHHDHVHLAIAPL
jgi:hypothetical protein